MPTPTLRIGAASEFSAIGPPPLVAPLWEYCVRVAACCWQSGDYHRRWRGVAQRLYIAVASMQASWSSETEEMESRKQRDASRAWSINNFVIWKFCFAIQPLCNSGVPDESDVRVPPIQKRFQSRDSRVAPKGCGRASNRLCDISHLPRITTERWPRMAASRSPRSRRWRA